MKVKVLIFTGYGINCEKELSWAFELAGGQPDIVHLEDVIVNKSIIDNYQIMAFPGGFSFGDHIASGKVFANIVKYNLIDKLKKFIEKDFLVIGICNGFQIIVKLGLVPDFDFDQKQTASLVENDSAHYEDRWVYLKAVNKNSPWLKDIDEIYLPARHGEGKFITADESVLKKLNDDDQIAFKYINPHSDRVDYPFNPNGSYDNIAGILNPKGNVLGLMPHPEAYIFKENHPRWTEGKFDNEIKGLKIFENSINYFK
ncbi:MAG: phosphoribosylformylglycinamidine synthase I [Spirochaetes bacterium]|nr:phosphoribosylformylglycinamidine synthase I [Spirochaetota bacterium]